MSCKSVFDTFPWLQTATVKQIDAVAAAARSCAAVRAEALPKLKGGFTTFQFSDSQATNVRSRFYRVSRS